MTGIATDTGVEADLLTEGQPQAFVVGYCVLCLLWVGGAK